MGGRTSSAVKNRWNKAHYERLYLLMPHGLKAKYQAAAERAGKSLTAFVLDAADAAAGIDRYKIAPEQVDQMQGPEPDAPEG